jgi:hypothetical protein
VRGGQPPDGGHLVQIRPGVEVGYAAQLN